jgi:hypothetical protein
MIQHPPASRLLSRATNDLNKNDMKSLGTIPIKTSRTAQVAGRHFKFEPLPKGTTDPMSHTPTKFNFTPLVRCPPLAMEKNLDFEKMNIRKKIRGLI